MSLTPPLSEPAEEAIESWSQLPRVLVITQDGAGSIATSESSGELRATQAIQAGNQRQAFLTRWRAADSEIVSLWGPPSTFTTTPSTNKPQIGHLHRVTQLPDGRTYQGIAVFHDAFLGAPSSLHCEVVTFDGITLGQLQDTPLSKALGKSLRVWWGRRFQFGGPLAEYVCDPKGLRLIEVGDVVRVQGMAASGMDTAATGVPVHSVIPEENYFRLNFGSPDQVDAAAGGTVTWVDTTNTAKNTMPYWVLSRVDGTTLRIKQWVHGEPEPLAWDHTVTFTHALTPLADGWNGLWVGHVQNGSHHRIRHMRIRRNR